ncbi:hypothetical protein HanXRQr2_Chr15g0684631 [Helianthus annuus]|uniref:Uncharacterized protein n=1 Tax=Helianthus annuus TaxID=4232 RepID=A0A251S8L0_HELAN|nr:hypothetical protein HanXRQr2_Chr15g0684631 [Helianthus annuus]KAJ0450565.1 hypothetical protein HanHA300_Chr15g0557731 [Helianthus annuus]KAJ0472417.1 hypothetical protein HanHA89_Chr15g0606841 [Helianthus annuus]KAJ0648018.1 hypothetical protein HanLR1_Chr15g0568201 [Helianthus annuus]KAJ0651866.1 hypothetical protein HanOQP8_Chr15g0565731 [Helianthus annuus]
MRKIVWWDGLYPGYWTEDMSLLCLFADDQPPTTREPPPLNRLVRDDNWDSCEVSAFCLPEDDGGLLLGMTTSVATIAPLSGLNDDDNLFGSDL